MGNIAVRIEGLGKQYRIGAHQKSRNNFREVLTEAFAAPFIRAGRILRGQAYGAADLTETIWALKDVGFEVKKGEVVGIIGRNGAGKSTLLKILSSITEPTTGRAEIYGRVGALLEVGTGFHSELTGRENIYLNGAILGMSREEINRKFDEIVAFAEVEKFIDTPVKHYSSGMGLRLGFAVAAHLEPEILIVDEVLAVGDASFQKKCLGKMSDVAGEGRTVLFVSHNMAAVSQLCSRGIWLEGGQVKQSGAIFELVEAYLSNGNQQQAERAWTFPGDAPGDDRVRLVGARVLQQGRVAPVIDINQPMQVELRFQVLRPLKNLEAGVNFHNLSGSCLFASVDWRPNHFEPGTYGIRLRVPPHIFAEGHIHLLLHLAFLEPAVQSVVLPDALGFDCADSAHPLAVRGLYKGNWPGLMRLHLDWEEPFRC